MNGEYNAHPYASHDDYNALLSSHQVDIQSHYYRPQDNNSSNMNPNPNSNPNPSSSNNQDVAKKFLFSVEDFLDTVRKLKSDFSTNGTLSNIGDEPSTLFNDIKYHLSKQNRIASDSLNRLMDGVKILKKLKTRCSNAFASWSSIDNLIQTVDATTKAHPDFNGIIAQREQEAKHRLAFLKRQQMAKQQQRPSSPPYYGGERNNNHYNYGAHHGPPPTAPHRNEYNNYNQYHGPPPTAPHYNHHRGPPPHAPQHTHHHYRGPPEHNHPPPRSHAERRTVYLYGFPRKWGATELRYLFDCIGETEDVDVLKRKGDTAFIHYIYPADAREAVEQMNNSCPLYCKRPINVEMADKSRLGIGMTKSSICWLYNQRTCQLGMTCTRQHVCLFCNGGHPRKQCSEIDKHFRKLRCDKMDAFGHSGGAPFRCSDFEITIDDIPINAANERDLRLLFNSAGAITRIKVMKPRKRNMKVRAYMEFADAQSLNNALKLNGSVWMGDTISVRKSSNNYRNSRYDRHDRDRSRDRDRDRMNSNNRRSRSRERGERERERDRERDRERMMEREQREREREREYKSSKNKSSKSIEVGGCIQKENGKIIIERKYQLNEVCTLFNGVTGCYSRDCEKIHVCSLCEDETHSLPKCPRSNTKIGEILMKQLQKENKKPGAAMSRIELNEKVKDKKRSLKGGHKMQPPKKKMKLENDTINNNNNCAPPKRITELEDVVVDYLLFVLDGNVWRRAQIVKRERTSIKIHFSGWDAKYDETMSIKDATHRLSVYKPDKFYSEATINKNVKMALKDLKTSKDVQELDIESVKKVLKLCQLKNDGPSQLLRERLLNVTDEIKIQNATHKADIIDVNMRRINELFAIGKHHTSTIQKENVMEKKISAGATKKDDKQYDKKKLLQICGNYNTTRGCNDADCELLHECELCGSERHINVDCPNNNL